MTRTPPARKARAIAHVRSYLPDAILLIDPPGCPCAAILDGPLGPILWYHDVDDGPPGMAWERMARSMVANGLI